MADNLKEREAFEAWFNKHNTGNDLARDGDDSEDFSFTQRLWMGWQGRAALAQAQSCVPAGFGGGLVAIKTLLSRDPCAHATTAIAMIDDMLAASPQPQPVQQIVYEQVVRALSGLLEQVEVFVAAHGEADFETAEALHAVEAAVSIESRSQAKPEQAAQPECTCLTGGLGPHYCERHSP